MTNKPVIVWIRRDLRLADHAALTEAQALGCPVIAVFIRDDGFDALGAAPKWRFGLGLAAFADALKAVGCQLVLRSGDALNVLSALVEETGADKVFWQRAYDPQSVARDTTVKAALKETGCRVQSYAGHLLFEPWTVETKTGGFYRVYSPMWRSVRDRDVARPLPPVTRLAQPERLPESEALADWDLGRAMRRGAEIVAPFQRVGEAKAQDRLGWFIENRVDRYKADRDFPALDATSQLSENLTYGEISPAQCWHAAYGAMLAGSDGAEHFLKELVWREFAYHLMWHSPEILVGNWKPDWDSFPWDSNPTSDVALAWKHGRTGIRFVDAAMREMYVTGKMHNRARMIVGSYLTKHLMTHWQIGRDWFAECLTDWDPASNAMGWQWVAGSGPDAAPYFRVFNPVTQLGKFDEDGEYANRWIAEGATSPHANALKYFAAIPKSWGFAPSNAYPQPIVTAEEGRRRALLAYENKGF